MIDLKVVVQNYPNSLKNRIQLAAILHDLYPTEKREVNLALAVYDCGIVNRISKMKTLELSQKRVFIKLLEDECGIREDYALQGILLWTSAFQLAIESINPILNNVAPKKSEGNKEAYTNGYKTEVTHLVSALEEVAKIKKDGFDFVSNILVNPDDYEIEILHDGTAIILKFCGFDEKYVVVPNVIAGHKIVGIGKEAYKSCRTMETLTISEGVVDIYDSAFFGCSNLKSIIFPQTLESIGMHAFECCQGLNQLSFPPSLREIKDNAFGSCWSIKSVVVNEGVEILGNHVFGSCSNLKKVLLPRSLKEVKSYWNPYNNDCDLFFFYSSTVYCYPRTFALTYARKKGYTVKNADEFTE